MDDDRIPGAAKKVRASVTEAIGKMTGDEVIERKGKAQKRDAEAEIKASETKNAAAKKNPKR